MSIQPRTKKTYLSSDQSWIAPGGINALDDADSIVLDRSAFDLAGDFPNGYVPSGVCLAKITATGLYGPYDNALSNGQEVAAGFLVADVEMDAKLASTVDEQAALYWHGEVDESNLPANHGLDAAGKTDLAAKFRFV